MINILTNDLCRKGAITQIDHSDLSIVDFKDKWIHLTNPTFEEIKNITKYTNCDESFIRYALDDDEKSRIEVEGDISLIIFDIPTKESDDFAFYTIPVGFIIMPNTIISVCLKKTSIIDAFINNGEKNIDVNKKSRFLYQILYRTHVRFLQYLREINKASEKIQETMNKATKNKQLIELQEIDKSLVYFSTSLRANSGVIERLTKFNGIKRFEEDLDLLEDVSIENKQAIEMTNIYRDILFGTMQAFASIISNNLNMVMKFLTLFTVMLSIPTLIASLFGMNTGVPFQGKLSGFWVITSLSFMLTAGVAFIMYKKKLL